MRRALAIVALATPFAFALIRAVQTGSDFRYFVLALAALAGAMAASTIGTTARRSLHATVLITISAILAATVFAIGAALWLGTRWGTGLALVAAGLAFAPGSARCSTRCTAIPETD